MKVIRWRNVAWMFGALAVIAVACVWGPVFAHQRQTREVSRLEHLAAAEALDRTGYWTCRQPWSDYQRDPATAQAVPELLISTGGLRHVSLTGNRVRVVESLEGSWTPPPIAPVPQGKLPIKLPPSEFIEAEAEINSSRAQRIKALFAHSIAKVQDERGGGADGSYYQIEMGGRCVETWTPDSWTGAGRLVLIGDMLFLRARRGAERDADRSQRAIDQLLASFEHGDGNGLMEFSGSRDLDDYGADFGAEWKELSLRARERH